MANTAQVFDARPEVLSNCLGSTTSRPVVRNRIGLAGVRTGMRFRWAAILLVALGACSSGASTVESPDTCSFTAADVRRWFAWDVMGEVTGSASGTCHLEFASGSTMTVVMGSPAAITEQLLDATAPTDYLHDDDLTVPGHRRLHLPRRPHVVALPSYRRARGLRHQGDQLVEGGAPAFGEAHGGVLLLGCLVGVHGDGAVVGAAVG